MVIAAAETVGVGGLAEIAACASGPPMLLVAPTRAAALMRAAGFPGCRGGGARRQCRGRRPPEAVALRLPPALLDPEMLRGLADPTDRSAAAGRCRSRCADDAAALGRVPPWPWRSSRGCCPPSWRRPRTRRPNLELLTVAAADVLAYPTAAARSLRPVAEAAVPLDGAPDARLVAFRAADGGVEHLAILVGRPDEVAARTEGKAPLARLHSECFTGDLLGSLRCDCGLQLRGAIRRMAEEGAGVLLYLAQEGRGIGLVNKLRAYRLQDGGLDTLDANRALGWSADERNFLVAATMLEHLGVPRVRLLTNNPDKLAGLAACGIRVEGREAHSFAPNGVNDGYLETKARRFGHLLA